MSGYLDGRPVPPPSRLRFLVFALAFALFRIFDIAKPYPCGISQRLPGGWGLVIDDMLAATYAALLLWLGITLVPIL